MGLFLTLAFLFFAGSCIGWGIEVIYRRFFSSANPERKWINPGFCTGPYLPLYGCGLCVLFLVASLEKLSIFDNPVLEKIALFIAMATLMTAIEYVAGVMALKITKVRLWDYRDEWANFQGIICPKFSFYWAILGAMYYFLVHPYILDALGWLSRNLAFSFVIGLFFGVFIMDAAKSIELVAKLKKYADENDIIVKYETLKSQIRKKAEETKTKYEFFRPFRSDRPLVEYLRELKEEFETRKLKK